MIVHTHGKPSYEKINGIRSFLEILFLAVDCGPPVDVCRDDPCQALAPGLSRRLITKSKREGLIETLVFE
jgi:hypothetical protein